MSYARVHLGRECRKCGMKFKQLATFEEEKGGITVKVYRYKCPFCDALVRKPTPEEVREALILKEMQKKE